MNAWHMVRDLMPDGSLDLHRWCVLGDGVKHAIKYSSTTFTRTTVSVTTKCGYGGYSGKDAQLMRGAPNCIACAGAP